MTAPVADDGRGTRLRRRFTTDDPAAAMLTAALLMWAVAVTVLIATALDLQPVSRRPVADALTEALLVAGGVALAGTAVYGLRARAGRIVAVGLPVVAVAGLLVAHLLTDDASAGAQFLFSLPVLYAAAHLRDLGITLVTLVAVVALAITAWILLPSPEAFSDTVSGAAILTAIAVGLATARAHHARGLHELRVHADTDPMTGAFHRHVLDVALQTALRGSHPDGSALVALDVDEFKSVNDLHGHPSGDAALRHVAQVLRHNVRPLDVISRLGGDEFAVLLPDCTHDAAVDRAERVLRDLRSQPVHVGDERIRLSVSVGVAHTSRHGDDPAAMYAAADDALYRAKRAGRGRVEGA